MQSLGNWNNGQVEKEISNGGLRSQGVKVEALRKNLGMEKGPSPERPRL